MSLKKIRLLVNNFPALPLILLTLALTLVLPNRTRINWFFTGMIHGYALYSMVDFLSMVKRQKHEIKQLGRESYIFNKIFAARKDEFYKYQLAHFIDKSWRN